MKRILVIQTAFLGDVVLTTPLLVALREQYPNCHIHFVTTPAGSGVLSGISWVTTHSVDKTQGSIWQSLKGVQASLKDFSFEAVYCVHRSPRSLLMGRLARAKVRYSFESPWAKLLRYQTTPYPTYEAGMHYKDKVLGLISGLKPEEKKGRLPFLEVERQFEGPTETMLSPLKKKPYVVLSPFSAWGTKMWPWERFQTVAQSIVQDRGWGVVVIGGGDSPYGAQEKEIGGKIAKAVAPEFGINLVRQTNLGELKVLLRGAQAVISNDSAPVHIAAAFRVPTLAIFGPTVEKWGFFPVSPQSLVVERKDVPCRPCSLHGPHECPLLHFNCMNKIEPRDVVGSLAALLPK